MINIYSAQKQLQAELIQNLKTRAYCSWYIHTPNFYPLVCVALVNLFSLLCKNCVWIIKYYLYKSEKIIFYHKDYLSASEP